VPLKSTVPAQLYAERKASEGLPCTPHEKAFFMTAAKRERTVAPAKLKRVMKVKLPIIKQRMEAKVGWVLLWLLGVPIPVLLILFLLRGCT
jgi:hypothetical protein